MLLGDQAFCGDEERAGTTEVTVARYERTQPHRINRLRQLASCFTSMKTLTEHGEPKKITTRLGRVETVSPEKAACNRPPGSPTLVGQHERRFVLFYFT